MTSKDETESVEKKEVSPAQEAADVKDQDATDVEKQIIKQVEFYFGDANLPRDKFMLEQVKLDDGWIPMSTMLKFQRLARLSSDPQVITAALHHSQLVEVDSAGAEPKLRRSPEIPLPEFNVERRKALMERTVYCKGFPLDTTMDTLMTILNANGPTENILMRKYKDKLTQKFMFKGSVFVTFATREEGQKFLDLESVKVGDVELIRMWQLAYHELKKIESRSSTKSHAKGDDKQGNGESKAKNNSFKRGATIYLKGDFLKLTREDLKEAVGKFGIETTYIAFNKGEKEAYLRLAEENTAQPAADKLGAELTVGEAKLTVSVLAGEEEETFLKKAEQDKKDRMQRIQLSKRSNRGGRHKRRGNRNRDDEASSEKKPKSS